MRKILIAPVLLAAVVAATMVPQQATASTMRAPAAAQARHKWADWNMKHIRLYGTWSNATTGNLVSGFMRDDRKDGRWVRVTLTGTDSKGKVTAQDYFYFFGGKRAYGAGPYKFGESPVPAHVLIRACLLTSMKGKPIGCGRAHRIF
jgi:hypothetical protein